MKCTRGRTHKDQPIKALENMLYFPCPRTYSLVRGFFFDNYFTCTRLMETLADRSILAAGTVHTNRKDLPVELKRNNRLKTG